MRNARLCRLVTTLPRRSKLPIYKLVSSWAGYESNACLALRFRVSFLADHFHCCYSY